MIARRENDSRSIVTSYERHLKATGKSAKTLQHYLGALAQFIQFCEDEGLPDLNGIRREHVELWLVRLRERYAPASVLNRYKALRVFYAWMVEEGEIRSSPLARIPQPVLEETRKDVVPPEELARVFKEMERKRRWRDCALLAILYDTGMRAGEVAELKAEDVKLDDGLIVVQRSKNKKMRTVGLSPQAVKYIDRYWRRPRSDLSSAFALSGHRGPLTANGIYQIVRGIFEELGFEAKIGPHDLRHTSASHITGEMTESQMMSLYGWTDPEMARHYARQALEKSAIEAHRRASPLSRLPKV